MEKDLDTNSSEEKTQCLWDMLFFVETVPTSYYLFFSFFFEHRSNFEFAFFFSFSYLFVQN